MTKREVLGKDDKARRDWDIKALSRSLSFPFWPSKTNGRTANKKIGQHAMASMANQIRTNGTIPRIGFFFSANGVQLARRTNHDTVLSKLVFIGEIQGNIEYCVKFGSIKWISILLNGATVRFWSNNTIRYYQWNLPNLTSGITSKIGKRQVRLDGIRSNWAKYRNIYVTSVRSERKSEISREQSISVYYRRLN